MPHTESHLSARLNPSSFFHAATSDVSRDWSSSKGRQRLPSITARFGLRLRDLRRKSGMTQNALAHHLGLDRSYLSDVERGKKNMSLSYLETVAQGFNITLAELLTDV